MPQSHNAEPSVPAVLDIVERAVLAVMFSFFAWGLLRSFLDTGNFLSLMLLVSEGAVVVFVLIRRPTGEISIRPIDWAIAFIGTALPLFAKPDGEPLVAPLFCAIVMLFGISLQLAAKLTLRRSFGVVAANRGVKVSGPYRFVRHPMYAGYVLTHIGFLLANPAFANLAVYVAAFGCQLARILAEENILSRDPAYRDFAQSVRYRLLPGIF
ncbi:hypothetical protein VW35_04445 [Devosia soli]|uniref:Isoprenylcysteine carboxyl methyltransferase n=1 Tax=Devosia soli TaxID=361041 RepID=A0A0F5LBP0_9HYPH|nr:isoprenylcysteine carboxylmethyltransferase family protein [Devosia soli]KKB79763.1 hypothetical protein VW35_04445 [Devosia soli]